MPTPSRDYDTYLYPHERIYYIVYRCDLVEKLFHTSSFYKISINKNCRCGKRDLQMVLQKDIPDFPHGCPAVRKDSFVLLPERFARCALPLRHPPSAGFSKVPSADSPRTLSHPTCILVHLRVLLLRSRSPAFPACVTQLIYLVLYYNRSVSKMQYFFDYFHKNRKKTYKYPFSSCECRNGSLVLHVTARSVVCLRRCMNIPISFR